MKLVLILPILLTWHLLFCGLALSHQVSFYVHNKCPYPIWPATASNTGSPLIANGSFHLPTNHTVRVDAPWDWTGRFWARTGCNFNFNSNRPQGCETGDCDGRLECNGLIGKPPATLIEIALQKNKPHFYDVSLVDGYNLPVSVTAMSGDSPKCNIKGCVKDLKTCCPSELQVVNKGGEIVACQSACLAFDRDAFCCLNKYGTPDKCKANMYSKMFKAACPHYYSYAYDMPPPLVSCEAKAYAINFCPSIWGGEETIQLHGAE